MKKEIQKKPVRRKRKKSNEQKVIDLLREEIKRVAKSRKTECCWVCISTKMHVRDIANALSIDLNEAVNLCSLLYQKGVLRFAGDMKIPKSEWHWKLRDWNIKKWDERNG